MRSRPPHAGQCSSTASALTAAPRRSAGDRRRPSANAGDVELRV
ncbi:hypothetical protein TEK04_10945 [Klenkia sp. LSe6-5]|uniref:Uncharacterized protein n=1 Tax=Klenkia sesuvii TaxID=3103137 RepID=A0ABU8DTR2_9ACTN